MTKSQINTKNQISTIVPVYNASKYLKRCIDSILLASKKGIENEILLVNDGSTDNSLDICLSYEKKYEHVNVYSQENKGPSAARNLGLEKVTNDWVTFVDSDDFISKDYYKVIEKNINDKLDLLIFGYNKISNGDSICNDFGEETLDRQQILKLMHKTANNLKLFWFPVTKVFNRKIIDKTRFSENIKIGEDTIFNMECVVKSKRIRIKDNCIYNYVENKNSLTQVPYTENLLSSMKWHFKKRMALHKKYNLEEIEYYRDISKYYIDHSLFWLLKNIVNKPHQTDLIGDLEQIRNTVIYEFTFQYYNFSVNNLKKNIIVFLFKHRLFRILKSVLK